VELSAEEVRVAGCLVEKHLTTPQQYPLTLAAVVAACNQTTNRHPVVTYDEGTVASALASLKERGLARFVHPSHGRSVTRYRHVLEETLGLDPGGLALVATLFLRGPQTPGELRARSERMATFDSLEDVERELDALGSRDTSLVARLARQPGQKEIRYAHLLAGDAAPPAGPPASPPPFPSGGEDGPAPADEVAALRDEVGALRRDLEEIRARLDR